MSETEILEQAPAGVGTPVETPVVEKEVAAQSPAASDPPADPQEGDLDRLLREYDESIGKQTPQDPLADQQRAEQQRLEQSFQNQSQQLQHYQQQEFQRAERADFDKILEKANGMVADLDLPEGWARQYLLAEGMRDPALREAFDNRNFNGFSPEHIAQIQQQIRAHGERLAQAAWAIQDPVQRQLAFQQIKLELLNMQAQALPDPATYRAQAARYIRGALLKMEREARAYKPIDSEATSVKEAVSFAVKGAGGKVAPEPPPNLGRMTNNELNRWSRDNFGFDAI
jgi:hypothetical protein